MFSVQNVKYIYIYIVNQSENDWSLSCQNSVCCVCGCHGYTWLAVHIGCNRFFPGDVSQQTRGQRGAATCPHTFIYCFFCLFCFIPPECHRGTRHSGLMWTLLPTNKATSRALFFIVFPELVPSFWRCFLWKQIWAIWLIGVSHSGGFYIKRRIKPFPWCYIHARHFGTRKLENGSWKLKLPWPGVKKELEGGHPIGGSWRDITVMTARLDCIEKRTNQKTIGVGTWRPSCCSKCSNKKTLRTINTKYRFNAEWHWHAHKE